MTYQNRVTPDMQLVAQTWRGDFMGNRGGRIHNPETKTILSRKWASKRWICCVTEFKNRHREIMGNSYTELFFLDEVSALTAGHRPCFECRRANAKHFASAWVNVFGKPDGSMADAMDKRLHEERTGEKGFVELKDISTLPDGAILKMGADFLAKKNDKFLKWSGSGYNPAHKPRERSVLLTPASILKILENGYKPHWHESAI